MFVEVTEPLTDRYYTKRLHTHTTTAVRYARLDVISNPLDGIQTESASQPCRVMSAYKFPSYLFYISPSTSLTQHRPSLRPHPKGLE